MSSHDQRPWQNMEQFDLEEALRIFCDTSIRNFLWGMWHEHRRAKILENKVAKQRQIINKRDDRISELNNSVQFLERTSEDRLMYIKQLEEREGLLEDRIHELETAYDEVDREYKATLGMLHFEQGLVSEQAETIRGLDDLLRRNTVDYAQQLSQLKMELEGDKGVGQ